MGIPNEKADPLSKIIFDDPAKENLSIKILQSVTEGKDVTLSKDDCLLILKSFGELSNTQKKYLDTISIIEILSSKLAGAREAFKSAERADKGAMDAVKILGWKHRNDKDKETRDRFLFYEYMELLFSTNPNDPLSQENKVNAIAALQKKYDMLSYNAAYKRIQRAVKTMKDRYGEMGGYQGLLPGDWPDPNY
jgi:hypothetical protein